MADTEHRQLALGDDAARQLANATKTTAQLVTISPRWLVHLLQWLPVEAGIYRLNKVKNPQQVEVAGVVLSYERGLDQGVDRTAASCEIVGREEVLDRLAPLVPTLQ